MKLNTDNPDLMPITDSVYGKRARQPDKEQRPRAGRQLWQALTAVDLAALRNRGGKETKRFFAIRTKEQS